jgi:hypothetical protein
MKKQKESDMIKGWFVGNFIPSCLLTQNVEVAVKRYSAGDREPEHYHKIATEITFIVIGQIQMNNTIFSQGDIVTVEPFEKIAFLSITDSTTVVVKIPGAINDKYIE